ncbi:glycosyltransferase family 2 protein [uncultured Parabacteroides sp.]|uniref:glycosyltransferase family 2 protein n=1 Tax=uncultured Parabacteroides sp. TaxID=512312 RepID=UPI0026140314|nr:glycosyltransferase family 2 protein [uncultured Parabacteroides sp.]
MINYSIIIPHRNIPKLLQRCLDSIPYRDDIQIIVVDDNSDPKVVDFDNFPGMNAPNVEVYFTKEGKGAGYARNVGLEHAKGKWILFADADDYFTQELVTILDTLKESNNDLIFLGSKCIDGVTKRIHKRDLKYSKLMKEALAGNKDKYRYNAYVPFAKIIRSDLIRDNYILFDETIVANDMMGSIRMAYCSKSTGFDDRCIYIREVRNGSLMSKRSIQYLICRFNVWLRVNDFLTDIGFSKYHINLIPTLIKILLKGNIDVFFDLIFILLKDNKVSAKKQILDLFMYQILKIKKS